jgi:CRISPR system Cascade subunit CasA
MRVDDWYWSTLEYRFQEILREYTLDSDPEDIRCQWLNSVRNTLNEAWERHRASVSLDNAWTIRALLNSEGPVLRKLRDLGDEIAKHERQEETV